MGGTSSSADVDVNNPSSSGTGTSGMMTAGIIMMAGGFIVDLVQTIVPKDTRWEKAFRKAVTDAVAPFFATYGSGAGRGSVGTGSGQKSPKFCPECGTKLKPGAKFCGSCGNRMGK